MNDAENKVYYIKMCTQ